MKPMIFFDVDVTIHSHLKAVKWITKKVEIFYGTLKAYTDEFIPVI